MKSYNFTTTAPWSKRSVSATGVVTNTSGRSTLTQDSLSGVVSAKGDGKKPNGQAFTIKREKFMKGRYAAWSDSSPYRVDLEGPSSNPRLGITLPEVFSSNAYNSCLSKMNEKLRGEIDLSIDLLQARQTRDTVSSLTKSLSMLNHKIPTLRRDTKAIASLFLQWKYGISPTIQTAYNMATLFREGSRNGLIRIKTTGSQLQRETVYSTVILVDAVTVVNWECSQRCLMDYRFAIEDSVLNNLASMSSLNPASVLYEMTPWSFVLDWFIDFGGYLRNLENAYLYHSYLKSGYITEGYRIIGDSECFYTKTSGGITKVWNYQGSFYSAKKLRSITPTLLPRAPRFKIDLGSSRLLSAAALLRQLMR